jgi:hypothetical protein
MPNTSTMKAYPANLGVEFLDTSPTEAAEIERWLDNEGRNYFNHTVTKVHFIKHRPKSRTMSEDDLDETSFFSDPDTLASFLDKEVRTNLDILRLDLLMI